MAARVSVAADVLRWAQRRSGRTSDELTKKFGGWDFWVEGRRAPTVNQVRDLADYTHVPFGYFFLPQPPEVVLPIPDFRVGRGSPGEPSQDLLDVIQQCQRRQIWYRDYGLVNGATALHFVGSARPDATPASVAAEMRTLLDFDVPSRQGLGSFEAARRHLMTAFESLGGLAIASSMVGNNTRRMLDVEEFQGFALADSIAPLIFVNAANTLAAQIFTLVHELAHVWRGESGVDDDPAASSSGAAERWCNAVASEVLVPLESLRQSFRSGDDLTEELDRLAQVYWCSALVVLIRLRDVGKISSRDFSVVYPAQVDRLRRAAADADARKRSGGGNFYDNQPYRIGRRLSKALVAETLAGRTPVTEALSLMSFSHVGQIDAYAEKLGVL